MQRFIEKIIFRLKHRHISPKEAVKIIHSLYGKDGVDAFLKEAKSQILEQKVLVA